MVLSPFVEWPVCWIELVAPCCSRFLTTPVLLSVHRRKALHQYDPADLQKAFAEVAAVEEELKNTEESTTTTVKGQELALAKERGLLVDTTAASPTSVADKLLDQWEAAADDDLEDAILDDSDDDML